MSEPRARFTVSWDTLHRDTRMLAEKLSRLPKFDGLVAVTRGGLVPAALVAREIGIRVIETISVASYAGTSGKAETERSAVRVMKPPAPSFLETKGENLLIVDDLVDSGATARALREMLPHAHLATVYAKAAGRPLVDTFVTEVPQDTWVDFPWDLGLVFQPPLSDGA